MTIIDYIFLAAIAIAVVVGLVKGFVDMLLGIVGLFVVTIGTAYLYQYPAGWLTGLIANDIARVVVALVATVLVLGIVFTLISRLIINFVRKIKALRLLDRILGAAFGFAFVYLIFAVVFSLLNYQVPEDSILSFLNGMGDELFASSVIATKIYTNNPIGDWMLGLLSSVKLPI